MFGNKTLTLAGAGVSVLLLARVELSAVAFTASALIHPEGKTIPGYSADTRIRYALVSYSIHYEIARYRQSSVRIVLWRRTVSMGGQ